MCSDHQLNIGSQVHLPSHGYPDYYPSNAYVLWTFQFTSGVDNSDIVYQLSFGNVRIDYGDYLRIGYGWNPENTSALIITYGHNYIDNPPDLYITATDGYVEFDASPADQEKGFKLSLLVRNITGTCTAKHHISNMNIKLFDKKDSLFSLCQY